MSNTLSENEVECLLKSWIERKSLDLSHYSVSADLGLYISDCIMSSRSIVFETVNLNNCNIPLRGFEAVISAAVDFKELTTFSAINNNLTREAGFSISKLLGARGRLKYLDLGDNRLSDVGIASIAGTFTTDLGELDANSMVSMLTLTELNLSGNNCGDMGVLALCRGLTQFSRHTSIIGRQPALKVLKLDRNNIGDKGALCFAQLLSTCTLSSNSSHLAGYAVNEYEGFQIKEISLNDNPIGPRGIIALLSLQNGTNEGTKQLLSSLGLAHCKVTVGVFDALLSNLQSGSSNLNNIDISINEADAKELIASIGSKGNGENWTGLFRKLSEAIVGSRQVPARIQLGTLPDMLFQACTNAKEAGNMEMFYDLVGAIDAICTVRAALQLSKEFLAKVSTLWSGIGARFPYEVISPDAKTTPLRTPVNASSTSASLTPSQIMEKQQVEFSRLRNEHTVKIQ